MALAIEEFDARMEDDLIALSLKAWAPVFSEMEPAVPSYVFRAFYPDGWARRQSQDVRRLIQGGEVRVLSALEDGCLVGFVGLKFHPEDRMGEIYILAVDPDFQRGGIATALMTEACRRLKAEGADIVMVETGGDPGHAPSRAVYEAFGFERWPVARYFKDLSSGAEG